MIYDSSKQEFILLTRKPDTVGIRTAVEFRVKDGRAISKMTLITPDLSTAKKLVKKIDNMENATLGLTLHTSVSRICTTSWIKVWSTDEFLDALNDGWESMTPGLVHYQDWINGERRNI